MVGKYFHLAATQVWTKPLAQRLGSSKAGDVCFVAAGRAGSGHEAGKSDSCISTAQTQLHTEHEAGRALQSLCSTHLSHCPSRPSVLPNKGLSNLFLILQRPKFVHAQATHSCFTGSLFLLPHTQVLPHSVCVPGSGVMEAFTPAARRPQKPACPCMCMTHCVPLSPAW